MASLGPSPLLSAGTEAAGSFARVRLYIYI